ncbi:MAG: hypothetical protein E6344_07395 [Clostridium sp.]|nr:hypothetical protein [Clostridium sp.]MDU7083501.1 hypothetical protein [Clostridium sp.]
MVDRIRNFIKKNFRFIWGMILFSLGIYYIYNNYERITNLDNTLDRIIIVSTLILAFLPFVSEISLLGFSMKKEITNVRKEMKEAIIDLKYQMIDIKSTAIQTNQQNVTVEYLASEEQLSYMTSKVNTDKKEKNISSEDNLEVSEEAVFLFKVRSTIEKYLDDLSMKVGHKSAAPISVKINSLYSDKLIFEDVYEYLKQVVAICNRGIHGEVISKEYIDFVKEIIPAILNELKKVDISRRYDRFISCSRCKYVGNSQYNNVCPRCGFVSDDE